MRVGDDDDYGDDYTLSQLIIYSPVVLTKGGDGVLSRRLHLFRNCCSEVPR